MFFSRETNGAEATPDWASRSMRAARVIANEAGENTRLPLEAFTDQFENLRQAMLTPARSLAKSVSEKTEANPLLAVGMAFAAGAMVANMFKRRVSPKYSAHIHKSHLGI